MSKPVQVYILMGQSNMLGFGKVQGLADACKNKGLYPYLINEDGSWTVRKDVRYVRVMCSGSGPSKTHNNEWMTIKGNVGPEMGIGHHVGHVTKAPVMILKSCIGNRSLGYDLLPPNAEGYAGDPDPSKRPTPGPWYAGVQYDGDVAAAKRVLADLSTFYPGARKYQVAGFFWWQGDKDRYDAAHAAKYEENLVHLIRQLREDFDAPKANFVMATLGQTVKGAQGNEGQILEAMFSVEGKSGKYREFKESVVTVYTNPLSKGGSSNGHYGGNAETYMNVGEAMGQAMAQLVTKSPGAAIAGLDVDALDSSLKKAYRAILSGKLSAADRSIRPYLAAETSRKVEQVAHARKLHEHLSILVEGHLETTQDALDRGDFCHLRDAISELGEVLTGLPAFDSKLAAWSSALATEEAIQGMSIGDKLKGIISGRKRSGEAAFFVALMEFKEEHPNSFYATQAEVDLAPIRLEFYETLDEIDDLEFMGALYTMSELIKESQERFAGISEFDEVHAKYVAASEGAEFKDCLAAGAAYAAVFEDLDRFNAQLESSLDKNSKITTPGKRSKADDKARSSYERKLKSLASKLEKLAVKHPENYYGRAAKRSHEAYTDTGGRALSDERER